MNDERVVDWPAYLNSVQPWLPAGTYRVRVEDVELWEGPSRQPVVNVWLSVLDGEHAGTTLVDRLSFREPGGARSEAFLGRRPVGFARRWPSQH
jgi:hypothetical protein